MIKLTITALGTPKQYQGQKGPYERNYLKAKEYNDKFLNFYVNKTTANWKVGDVVEVESVEEKQYTSKAGELKTSYDIKLPKFGGNGDVMKALEEIRNTLAFHGLMLADIGKAVSKPIKDDYPSLEASTGLKEGQKHPFDNDAELRSLEEVAEQTYNAI